MTCKFLYSFLLPSMHIETQTHAACETAVQLSHTNMLHLGVKSYAKQIQWFYNLYASDKAMSPKTSEGKARQSLLKLGMDTKPS